MIQRLAQLFGGEVRGIHNAAYILAVFAVLSSLLGFFRDRMLAHTFGAGEALDLYYAAFRIPDLIFVMLASLVSAYVLIPEFVRRDEAERKRYIETIFFYFSCGIIVISAIVYALAPRILEAAFPALMSGENSEHLVLLTRIMLLQPIFLGFSNIFATITQARNRYVVFAISPLLYNIGIIIGIVALYPMLGIEGLAWGVVLGAFLHAAAPLPTVLRDGFLRFRGALLPFQEFVRTILLSLPRTFALSANQGVFFVLMVFAASLTAGSIAAFSFAFNLQSVPLAIIGVSYSVAAFPTLVAMHASGQRREFLEQVALASRHIIFWTVPAIVLLIVLRAHAVRVILGSGQFDWSDTRLTAAAFAIMCIALTAHALMSLLARAYYATGKSWTPFVVNVGAGLFAIGAAVFFIDVLGHRGWLHDVIEAFLRVEGVPGTEMLALPLAYAVGAIVATLLLAILFEFRFRGYFAMIIRIIGTSLAASLVGGFAAYTALNFLGGISEATTLPSVFFHAFIAGSVGLAAIAGVYLLLRSPELAEMRASLTRRFGPKQPVVVASEDETGVTPQG